MNTTLPVQTDVSVLHFSAGKSYTDGRNRQMCLHCKIRLIPSPLHTKCALIQIQSIYIVKWIESSLHGQISKRVVKQESA